ncbi:MAG TPA: PIG-L family deacetylase [Methylomirabilota bacterium]|nr:PIG-L family deacetylase [Methylomirabilota bacterium]
MKKSVTTRKAALAIAAHPDDIEFMMAGTLLLLRHAGWETHYLNLSTGSCGSMTMSPAKTRATRKAEAQRAAQALGAKWWPSICDDLEIMYELRHLRKVAAIVRSVNPAIVLTHSPEDYMEDHVNASRLAVTAAFAKGFPNFATTPSRKPVAGPVTVYHAMPHGLVDPLRRKVAPDCWINTASVQEQKRQALAEHRSQKDWLDQTQGMNSYVQAMDDFAADAGKQSKKFPFAEGWRRRLHYGFSPDDADPLKEVLGSNYLEVRQS